MTIRQTEEKQRAFARREMVQRRLAEERQHDDEDERTEVASYQAMISRLDRVSAELAERCPACGEPADNCQPYVTAGGKGRKMLRCPICKTCVPDRRGVPVPPEITRALQRMEIGEGND